MFIMQNKFEEKNYFWIRMAIMKKYWCLLGVIIKKLQFMKRYF